MNENGHRDIAAAMQLLDQIDKLWIFRYGAIVAVQYTNLRNEIVTEVLGSSQVPPRPVE